MSRLCFSGNYCEIALSHVDVNLICVSGSNDIQVQTVLKKPYVKRQLKLISNDTLIKELEGYGAWDDVELQDYAANCARIIWIAAWSINDEQS